MCFFFNDTATTEIYTLSLHDALPIYAHPAGRAGRGRRRPCGLAWNRIRRAARRRARARSEEHTSELQSPDHLVCRLLLEKKKEATVTAVRARPPWRRRDEALQWCRKT